MSNTSWDEQAYRQAKRDRKARAKDTRELSPPRTSKERPPATLQELIAVERHMAGRARGEDFVHVASFLKKSGALDGLPMAKLSDRDLADTLQRYDYLISEGAIDLVDDNGDSLLGGDE